MGSTSGGNCPKIMVFRPTIEEMKNFEAYINTMESVGAHKAGLAKIIPPKEWVPRKNGYDNIQLYIPSPIEQIVHGQQGLYTQYNIQKKAMHVKEFQRLAETSRYKTPPHFDFEDLERKYWKNISFNPPIYGADVSGSLTDSTLDEFNINRLNTILDLVGDNYGIKIEGVNTAYLYFGMWKTTFPWHTEDMDLYSINYLHFGAPKSWYAIPPEHGKRLERLAAGFFPSSQQECSAFLRHKMTLISPQILKQYSIPYNKITQEAGEFMITFPYGYHAGFNHGFNCAESTNFATLRWIEYGKRAFKCTCRKDGVKISMDVFVRTFQPERYDMWLEGKDMGCHPEDTTRFCAAPPPSKSELSFWKSEGGRMQSLSGKMEAVPKRLPFATQPEGCKRLKSKATVVLQKLALEEDKDTDDTEIYEPDASESSSSTPKKLSGTKPKKIRTVKTTSPVSRPVRIRKQKVKGVLSDENKKPNVGQKLSPQAKKTPKRTKKSTLQNPSGVCVMSVSLPDVKTETGEERNSPCSDSPVPSQEGSHAPSVATIPKLKIQKQGSLFHCSRLFDPSPSILKSEQKYFVTKLKYQTKDVKTKSVPVILVSSHSTNEKQLIRQIVQPSLQCSVLSHTNGPPALHNQTNQSVASNQRVNAQCFSASRKLCDMVTKLKPECQSERTQDEKCAPLLTALSPCSIKPIDESICAPVLQPVIADEGHNKAVDAVPNQICGHEKFNQNFSDLSSIPSLIFEGQRGLLPNFFKKVKCKSSKREGHCKKHKERHSTSSKNRKGTGDHLSRKLLKSLGDLWQHQPQNFKAEKAFNLRSSATEPHCSICIVFRAFKSKIEETEQQNDVKMEDVGEVENVPVLPSRSQVLVPASLFSAVTKDIPESESFSSSPPRLLLPQEAALDSNPLLAHDGSAPLFRCRDCRVCIHATCYGILREETDWLCDRCRTGSSLQDCCLCSVRGGAMKQTTAGLWVHVVCAILIPEAFFTNVITKDVVDLSDVTKQRKKLKCNFCWPLVRSMPGKHVGICVQCTSGKCCSSFHAYCGYMAGVSFEPYYGPYPVRIICHRHNRNNEKVSRVLRPLRIGEFVIGKQSNKRYYHCEVLEIENKVLYSVEFDTTSYCDNVLKQDILTPLSSLVVGEPVEVRWLDGLVYTCTYKGLREMCNVKVEFADGSQVTVQRDELYTKDEALPKRVFSRLSFASDRKNYFQEESATDVDHSDAEESQ